MSYEYGAAGRRLNVVRQRESSDAFAPFGSADVET